MAEEKYKFTEDYYTGIPFIDEEHRHLFELANEAYDTMKDEFMVDKYDKIVELIEELSDYTKTHFAHEEEYMKSINFQYFWSELRAHKMFVAKMDSYDLSQIDQSQDQAILDLLDFLTKWLTVHIKGADHRIGEATKKLEAAGDKNALNAGKIQAAADKKAGAGKKDAAERKEAADKKNAANTEAAADKKPAPEKKDAAEKKDAKPKKA